MKKIVTILIGLAFIISSYAQKEKLELNLNIGENYNQITTSDLSILQTINGQQVNIKMSINAKTTFKVTNFQNSVYDMEVSYKSLVMKMILPNGEMNFSSDKNDETDIFSTILGSMKNKPFLIKMTKTGKVNEVKNIDAVFSDMFNKFPQLNDDQKQQIKGQIMQAYGEKAFKGNIEMCSAIFSDASVEIGDKWIINTQLESGMSVKLETTYELKEKAENYYRILGNSKIETADKDAYIQSNGMPLKYDMTGNMNSDIKIDKRTGWTMNAVISQSIKGNAYIKSNPQMPEGMTIPMAISTEMTITE